MGDGMEGSIKVVMTKPGSGVMDSLRIAAVEWLQGEAEDKGFDVCIPVAGLRAFWLDFYDDVLPPMLEAGQELALQAWLVEWICDLGRSGELGVTMTRWPRLEDCDLDFARQLGARLLWEGAGLETPPASPPPIRQPAKPPPSPPRESPPPKQPPSQLPPVGLMSGLPAKQTPTDLPPATRQQPATAPPAEVPPTACRPVVPFPAKSQPVGSPTVPMQVWPFHRDVTEADLKIVARQWWDRGAEELLAARHTQPDLSDFMGLVRVVIDFGSSIEGAAEGSAERGADRGLGEAPASTPDEAARADAVAEAAQPPPAFAPAAVPPPPSGAAAAEADRLCVRHRPAPPGVGGAGCSPAGAGDFAAGAPKAATAAGEASPARAAAASQSPRTVAPSAASSCPESGELVALWQRLAACRAAQEPLRRKGDLLLSSLHHARARLNVRKLEARGAASLAAELSAVAVAGAQEVAILRRRHRQMRDRLAQLTSENGALEAQLGRARHRTAELAQRLAEATCVAAGRACRDADATDHQAAPRRDAESQPLSGLPLADGVWSVRYGADYLDGYLEGLRAAWPAPDEDDRELRGRLSGRVTESSCCQEEPEAESSEAALPEAPASPTCDSQGGQPPSAELAPRAAPAPPRGMAMEVTPPPGFWDGAASASEIPQPEPEPPRAGTQPAPGEELRQLGVPCSPPRPGQPFVYRRGPRPPLREELLPQARAALLVTIAEARGLPATKYPVWRRSDPFCAVHLEGNAATKHRTEVQPATLDPRWDQQVRIEDFVPGDTLVFEVWDHNAQGQHGTLLGRATLPSREFYPQGWPGNWWLPLGDFGGTTTAQLRVVIEVLTKRDLAEACALERVAVKNRWHRSKDSAWCGAALPAQGFQVHDETHPQHHPLAGAPSLGGATGAAPSAGSFPGAPRVLTEGAVVEFLAACRTWCDMHASSSQGLAPLECLDLSDRGLGPREASALFQGLAELNIFAKCIDLAGNELRDAGVSALCRYLAELPSCLEELSLTGNKLTAVAVHKLLSCFSCHRHHPAVLRLQRLLIRPVVLKLSDNEVTDPAGLVASIRSAEGSISVVDGADSGLPVLVEVPHGQPGPSLCVVLPSFLLQRPASGPWQPATRLQ